MKSLMTKEIVASMLYEISVASWCFASSNDRGSHDRARPRFRCGVDFSLHVQIA